jgi:hypothetical protein
MDESTYTDPEITLRQWRASVLNGLLIAVVLASLPALGLVIVSAAAGAVGMPTVIILTVCEVLLAALALLRRLPYALRVGGTIAIGYLAAAANLASGGLGGGAPLYLLVIPLLTLILAGSSCAASSPPWRWAAAPGSPFPLC